MYYRSNMGRNRNKNKKNVFNLDSDSDDNKDVQHRIDNTNNIDDSKTIQYNAFTVLDALDGDSGDVHNYTKIQSNNSPQKNDESYFKLGLNAHKQNKLDDAKKYYTKSIEETGSVSSMFNLANIYYDLDDDEPAIKYYKMAIQKKHRFAPYNLALLYWNQDDYDSAMKYFKLCDFEHFSTTFQKGLLSYIEFLEEYINRN